ncbi:MAG: TetR/AcrR family transcriptional regulator [Peptostreptococcales bacterium]|jgi:AcrR family transcriptional regulator
MKEKKFDKRKAQGAETKKRLYEIAERLYKERNFSDVNVEDITEEAGITKGAFYVHYDSKDALIAILIADHAAKADMDYKAFLESLPIEMPASQALLSLAEKIADTLTNTFGYKNMAKIYQMLLSGTEGTEAIKGYGRELYALVYNVFEKGIHSGEFISSIEAETLSRHFVMAMRGVSYEWCVHYPDFDLRENAIIHCKLLIEGIKSK